MKCKNCLNTGQVIIEIDEEIISIVCPVCLGKFKNIIYPEDLTISELEDDIDNLNYNEMED